MVPGQALRHFAGLLVFKVRLGQRGGYLELGPRRLLGVPALPGRLGSAVVRLYLPEGVIDIGHAVPGNAANLRALLCGLGVQVPVGEIHNDLLGRGGGGLRGSLGRGFRWSGSFRRGLCGGFRGGLCGRDCGGAASQEQRGQQKQGNDTMAHKILLHICRIRELTFLF